MHATDPATVFLGAAIRIGCETLAPIEQALYDDRTVVRMLGMRRTLFVEPIPLVPIIAGACTRTVAVRERKRLEQHLAAAGIGGNIAQWLRRVEKETLAALRHHGQATAAQLGADVAELRTQLHFGEGKKWEGVSTVTGRVLTLLAAEGKIVRGRPRGSWISTQYLWVPMDGWLQTKVDERPTADARADLATRWLRAFGPATLDDLQWWTGWSKGETGAALAAIETREVELEGSTGIILADDLDPDPAPEPWAALLPALDSSVMGWSRREWYLGAHAPLLFDRSGNAGPTVWCDGRIVGGWGQLSDGEVVYELFEDVGADAVTRIDASAERVAALTAGVRVVPRFRTPTEREISLREP